MIKLLTNGFSNVSRRCFEQSLAFISIFALRLSGAPAVDGAASLLALLAARFAAGSAALLAIARHLRILKETRKCD